MAKQPLKYMLINPLKIRTEHADLDLSAARTMADEKGRSLCPVPMLVSWYDATTGKSYPDTESRIAGKPGWLDYAESRRCDVTVDINDEQFVFVYTTKP